MDIYETSAKFNPSDIYLDVADFSTILEDIARGVIPTGTNRPFPVFSSPQMESEMHSSIPWFQTNNSGTLNL
jgi:hypothetical protein